MIWSVFMGMGYKTLTWKDGTTHVVIEPQVLLERPCALVPRLRKHLVTSRDPVIRQASPVCRQSTRRLILGSM
jgi:hypothetical protein